MEATMALDMKNQHTACQEHYENVLSHSATSALTFARVSGIFNIIRSVFRFALCHTVQYQIDSIFSSCAVKVYKSHDCKCLH